MDRGTYTESLEIAHTEKVPLQPARKIVSINLEKIL